jgi:hypothetical protein
MTVLNETIPYNKKTGALRFPVFKLDRTTVEDKPVEECLLGNDIKAARTQEEDE